MDAPLKNRHLATYSFPQPLSKWPNVPIFVGRPIWSLQKFLHSIILLNQYYSIQALDLCILLYVITFMVYI